MKKDLLYIPVEISVIKDMTDRELADYLATLLDRVEPDVLNFVKNYRGILVITDDMHVSDEQLYVPMVMLLNGGDLLDLQFARDAIKTYQQNSARTRPLVLVRPRIVSSFPKIRQLLIEVELQGEDASIRGYETLRNTFNNFPKSTKSTG